MKEEWRDIIGYEGYYQVSNLGRVRGIDRIDSSGRLIKGKIKNIRHTHDGYCITSLSKNNIKKNYRVHRLVAQAFIPNPNNLPEVNHKDENKDNNAVDNLEWCDGKYNVNYGTGIERRIKKQGKPVIAINKENGLILTFDNMSEASRILNINRSNLTAVINKNNRTAGGYYWITDK